MKERSPTLSIRFQGSLACFTRPEFKTERVSYPVMTPSAARGAIEAVLWKPAIRWRVEQVHVLAPISFVSFRRNEVNSRVPTDSVKSAVKGADLTEYLADEDRAQRNTVALRDVDYVVDASFALTAAAGPGDNVAKFIDMFDRRVAKGQAFHQPYLGCREFVADFGPADGPPRTIEDTVDLGIMLLDVDHDGDHQARFFEARLERGVLKVPPTGLGEVNRDAR